MNNKRSVDCFNCSTSSVISRLSRRSKLNTRREPHEDSRTGESTPLISVPSPQSAEDPGATRNERVYLFIHRAKLRINVHEPSHRRCN